MTVLFLFISLPNLTRRSGIFSSLIHEFVKHGNRVLVSSRSVGNESGLVVEDGIPVLRVNSPEFVGVQNKVKKALAYQTYIIKQRHYIKETWGNETIDLIVSHSLPPEIAYVVSGLKKFYRSPFYLIQTDFIWQDAVAYGYFRKDGLICRYYRFWEKRMFHLADYIGCPTKGNVSFIQSLYPLIEHHKYHYLPFWKTCDIINPDYSLKNGLGLNDKFVVVYGGSVGAAQRVEIMVNLAEECKAYKDIVFLLVGKGVYLETIKNLVIERHLNNFIIKDFLPQNQYLNLLATCDVGLIILNEKMATPNFPSKSLSYLNMRVPILAALDYVTDFGDYLVENKAGLWAHSDRIQDLKEKLLMYYHSKELRQSTAENGYRLFINNLTPEHAYYRIMKSLEIE